MHDNHHLKLHVLGSGSKGNAAIVENTLTGEGVMVDCGLCKRAVFEGAQQAGFDLRNLRGILITHEHTDHTKGLGVTLRGLDRLGVFVPLYASMPVRRASAPLQDVERDGLAEPHQFAAGSSLSLAGMQIHVFPTSHDAADSFGFRFELGLEGAFGGEDAVGYMTDTGMVTPEAHEALLGVRLLALEANHDPQMLKEGPYPYPVKKRIASNEGHLSNQQSAAELEALLSNKLEQVVAMHISENNNTYGLPVRTLREVTQRLGHTANVQAAYQHMLVSVE